MQRAFNHCTCVCETLRKDTILRTNAWERTLRPTRLQNCHRQAVVKEAIRRHPEVSYTLERVVPQEREAQCGMMLREALY